MYRWSIGGNRVQIKAETHILSDIQSYLEVLDKSGISPEGPLKSSKAKQELLSVLISNEQTRLMVWLFPLDYNKKHHFTSGQHSKALTDVSAVIDTECSV
jgi:phosphatidylinositol 4-kinase